jgi:PqqD family protein of HPr-rel-A system
VTLPVVWQLASQSTVCIKSWDDDLSSVAFDRRSGDTFMLGPLATEILAELACSGPQTGQELVERFTSSVASLRFESLAAEVDGELELLNARGLVRRMMS